MSNFQCNALFREKQVAFLAKFCKLLGNRGLSRLQIGDAMNHSTTTMPATAKKLPEAPAANFEREAIPLEQRTDITVEELERLSLPMTAELYDGRLIFKIANPLHGAVQGIVITELNNYLERHPVGMAFTEAHFQLDPDRPNRARIPDVSFVAKDRLPKDLSRIPAMALDLAVEILSRTESFLDVMDKVDEYLQQGTKIVWLVIPSKEEVLVCTAEGKYEMREVLTAPELLPGLELPVQKIFARLQVAS